jgi:hypothetical protein
MLLVDDDVIVSYGGAESGKNDFAAYWELDRSKARLFNKLEEIVELGGEYNDRIKVDYVFPFIRSSRFVDFVQYEDSVFADYSDLAYSIKEDVLIIDAKSEVVIDTIDKETILLILESESKRKKDETLVRLIPSQKTGRVKNSDIYFCNDYILSIRKDDEQNWKISVFASN